MGGEAGGDATQETGLPSRLFGGVSREAAAEAIAAAERRAAELEAELETLRTRVAEQDQELDELRALSDSQAERLDALRARVAAQREELEELRGKEELITSILVQAEANAKKLRGQAEQQAQERLHAVEAAIGELRDQARQAGAKLLKGVKQLMEELEPLAASAHDVVERTGVTAPVEDEPASADERAAAEVESAGSKPVEGGVLEVAAAQLPSPRHAVSLERWLSDLAGVRNVDIKLLTDDEATFVLGFEGDLPDLTPLLAAGIDIVSAGRERVELRLPADL